MKPEYGYMNDQKYIQLTSEVNKLTKELINKHDEIEKIRKEYKKLAKKCPTCNKKM